MNVVINANETHLTLADKNFISRRLQYALRHYSVQIEQIEAWVVGIVRSEDEEALYCLAKASLADGRQVISDGTDAALKPALNTAAVRIGREVALRLGRKPALETNRDANAQAWIQRPSEFDKRAAIE